MATLPINHSGATSDEHLVKLWLLNRPEQTQKGYRRDAAKFLASIGKPLYTATVADVGAWIETLTGSDHYKARRLISIKSLLTFAHETGYHVFNVGSVIRLPRLKRKTHERIMEERVARDMISMAKPGRDTALLRLFLASGCRVSEAVNLNFGDLGKGVVTFFGKGGKTRSVPVHQDIIDAMLALRRPEHDDKTPVFRTHRGTRLSTRAAQRITEAARTEKEASPHWFRHCHATTSLKNGAPLIDLKHQLGHANIATTDIYLHLIGDHGSGHYIDP